MFKKTAFALIFIILCFHISKAVLASDDPVHCACSFGDCAGICELPNVVKDILILRTSFEPRCIIAPACSQIDISKIAKDAKNPTKRDISGHRERKHNLIVNGDFELGFLSWWQYDINIGEARFAWGLQSSSELNHEKHLPQPDGNYAAMTTRIRSLPGMVGDSDDVSFLGLYQDFSLSDLEDCDYIKLRLSFKYFIRNHANKFVPGGIFQNGVQVFRVDVLDGFFNQVWNAFITDSGDHFEHQEHEYKTFKRKFYISNAINAIQFKSLRLRFGVFETLGKLTVGIDDVKLEAKCANFPRKQESHHEEHHQEHHEEHHQEHHEEHHQEHHEEHQQHGNSGHYEEHHQEHHEEHHQEHHENGHHNAGHQENHQGAPYQSNEEEKKRGKNIVLPK